MRRYPTLRTESGWTRRRRTADSPILLAISDNGPQLTAGLKRVHGDVPIAQHFGRPGTPGDRAWIESPFSHIKAELPHFDCIRDPEVLRSSSLRSATTTTRSRLNNAIGYVTPADEHQGHGPRIRAAENAGYVTPAGRASPTINYRRPSHPPSPKEVA